MDNSLASALIFLSFELFSGFFSILATLADFSSLQKLLFSVSNFKKSVLGGCLNLQNIVSITYLVKTKEHFSNT